MYMCIDKERRKKLSINTELDIPIIKTTNITRNTLIKK